MNLRFLGVVAFILVAPSLPAQGWKAVPGHIMTPWADQVNPQAPLPEYPRPQLVRSNWVNLNGLWDYAIQPFQSSPPQTYAGKILVPFPIESALSGLKLPLTAEQRLWYRRTFEAPELSTGERLLLHFGAVDWEARVIVNGQVLGEHRGGYDPFSFDVTEAVKPGAENELVVAVADATGGFQPKGKQNFNKIAKPGGIAYTPSSGIWQTVWLETVPANYIQALKITPDVDQSALRLQVVAAGAAADMPIEAVALDGTQVVATVTGKPGVELVLPLEKPRLWTPDDPFLYALKVRMGRDKVDSYFGLRKIAIGKDEQGVPRMLLNNKFVFQVGPLDQGFWPDGIHTAPTDEALRFDIEEMKRLGFNMVRKHIKVEPERWFYWCDKLGLLVWQDMPSAPVGKGSSPDTDGVATAHEGAQQFETELKAMIQTRFNHPSIIMWVIFNEGWGQYDTARLTKWVKQLDSTRLVNSTSGWHDQQVGDVIDAHSYPGPVSPKPDGRRAAVLGEFGGLGLGMPGHNWVESAAWGYRAMSGPRELTRKYLELWRKVWQLKDDSGLCAAVYTQLTDIETECNGLLSYDRKVRKLDVATVAEAHRGNVPPPPGFSIVAPTAAREPVIWNYTFEAPGETWHQLEHDDANWQKGPAAFGDGQQTNQPPRTPWSTAEIWMRRQVHLKEGDLKGLALTVFHEGDFEVFLNGVLALRKGGRSSGYDEMDIKPEAEAALKTGVNLVGVHARQSKTGNYIDVGLVTELPGSVTRLRVDSKPSF